MSSDVVATQTYAPTTEVVLLGQHLEVEDGQLHVYEVRETRVTKDSAVYINPEIEHVLIGKYRLEKAA